MSWLYSAPRTCPLSAAHVYHDFCSEKRLPALVADACCASLRRLGTASDKTLSHADSWTLTQDILLNARLLLGSCGRSMR